MCLLAVSRSRCALLAPTIDRPSVTPAVGRGQTALFTKRHKLRIEVPPQCKIRPRVEIRIINAEQRNVSWKDPEDNILLQKLQRQG